MVDVSPQLADTLRVVAETGTFDAAARALRVTPSAVSLRVRALEEQLGRPVVRRTRPVELTEAGRAVVRFARELELLRHELAGELGSGWAPQLAIVVNGDSLATWVLPALAGVARTVRLELLREDQAHSLDLVRDGTAAAAITSVGAAVPGCTSHPLGVMRYRAMAAPAFVREHFGDADVAGVAPAALAAAPVVVFDRKDDLQDLYLRRRTKRAVAPPRHHVPASADFQRAIELGFGWGMLPDLQSADAVNRGALVPLDPGRGVDVALHWQQWKLPSRALDAVAGAIAAGAASALERARTR